MWIAFNDGFLSIVTADMDRLPKRERRRNRGTGMLCVRARKPEHLSALFPDRKIYCFAARDYPARIFIAREDLAEFVAARVLAVDYGNFKNSVADNALHDAYSAVWSVMHRYQHGAYDQAVFPRWTTNGGLLSGRDLYDRGGGPWGPSEDDWKMPDDDALDDEVDPGWFEKARWRLPDDASCGLLGCTPDAPCRDCISDALRAEQPDRYGDFDTGDDRDDDDGAQSHLRFPPR